MRLDTTTRYGFRLVANLAKDSGIKSLADISKEEDISRKYLEQIVIKLKNEKIIRGFQGANGGYVLSRSADKIPLIKVYQALENRKHIIFCLDSENPCERSSSCSTIQLWRALDDSLSQVLKSHTVADLVSEKVHFKGPKDESK